MKRKVMSAIMALCLLVSTMGWSAMPALAEGEGTGCKHGEKLKLPDSGVINLDGNNYYLDEDLIISRPTTITFRKDASLCLNGFKIDADGHKLQINIMKGYEFRIFDCSNALREGHLDANGLWQEGKAEQNEVDMPIYGGAIIGAVSTMPLIQSYGTFYLESGNLVGNTNSATAIMRTQEQGIIVINGGMIMGNAASAIKVDTDTSGKTNGGIGEINGGIISNNKSSYATIKNRGTLTVTGGELTDNQSTEQAGGILCAKNATLKLSGNPLIKNNIGKDGRNNVYLEEKPIEITGALQSSAPIGIGMATLGPITNGWQTHMSGQAPSKYFSSDQTGLWVSEENGEAILTNQKPELKAPAIIKQPQSLILTQGEGGTLSVEATTEEGAMLSYQWYQATDATSTANGVEIKDATDANLTIGADAPAGTTHYYCVVTASRGSETKTATSNIATVTVQKPEIKAPEIIKQPQDLNLKQGEGGTLSVEATAEEGATSSYQWYQAKDAASTENGVAIKGATDANLTIGADAPAGTTHYYCVVTASRDGESKTATSNIATVAVQRPALQAPVIKTQPQSLTLTQGDGGMLSVEATAEEDATLSYQWYQATDATSTANGVEIKDATDANLTIGADAPAGTTHYYCVVTASRGSETKTATSNIATVTVQKPEIKAPEIIKQPQDLNLKQGEGGTLSVEATAEEGATLSYQWYQATDATSTANGVEIKDATDASLAIDKNAPAGTTYYYCVVTANRDGVAQSVKSAVATVMVDARPVSPDRPSKPKPPTEQPGETVTNPDGSVTTTVTKPNGMVVATTKYPNGDCMILSTAPSGEMDVTFKGAKERLVTIPVEALGPEIVAYVTDANGMCRLEMRTAVTEMGMTILVHDGDSIELVQKTVNFTDVPDQHWAKAPITYVAARGLLIGVEDTLFAPSMQTSRAMIWSILARLEGVQLEETTPWYASSQAWAVDAAISDGNNPNADISREQLVTMLYRYANSPAVNSDLTAYSDGSQVSAWAVDAVQWAVSEGIMNGITADTLAPQETATRAQTAAILERFIAWQLSVA